MVRIINYQLRQSEDGKSFYVLELQGGIEMVMSQQTGQFYATAKKANITSTFDEATCKALIGTQMPGKIVREDCEPYQYVVKDTGEIIVLSHRYIYNPEEVQTTSKQENAIKELLASEHKFSENGVLEKEFSI